MTSGESRPTDRPSRREPSTNLGLTVPDIDEATEFFGSAFGAQPLYDTLEAPAAGALLEQSLDIPEGTTVQRVRMLGLANGPSLELFEYGDVEQRAPLRACDFGVQHFALYVDDLDTALAAVVAAGARPSRRRRTCRAWRRARETGGCMPTSLGRSDRARFRTLAPGVRGDNVASSVAPGDELSPLGR